MMETTGPLYSEPQALPDIITKGLSVLFCGINPGLEAAKTGHHFAGKNNRFWTVLHRAGFTPVQISPENDVHILKYGCGLTAAIGRATASAAELFSAEFLAHTKVLEEKINLFAPRIIAFLGKAAYAAISQQRHMNWGLQDQKFGGAAVWVLPNPSGRNRSFAMADLVTAYHELYRAYAQPLK